MNDNATAFSVLLPTPSSSNIKIRVGSLRNDRDGWLFDVRNYFLHEAFAFDARTSKVASYDNDIALLQTNERIRLAVTAAVMKIRLPPAAFEAKNGTQLNVVGWGRLVGRSRCPSSLISN